MDTLFNEAALELALDDRLAQVTRPSQLFSFYIQEIDGFRYVHPLDQWDELVIGYEQRPDFACQEIELILVEVNLSNSLKPFVENIETMFADFDKQGALTHCPYTDNLNPLVKQIFEELFPEQNTSQLFEKEKGQNNKKQDWELLAGELNQILLALECYFLDEGLQIEEVLVNEYLPYLI